jgi:hypothetical protein
MPHEERTLNGTKCREVYSEGRVGAVLRVGRRRWVVCFYFVLANRFTGIKACCRGRLYLVRKRETGVLVVFQCCQLLVAV